MKNRVNCGVLIALIFILSMNFVFAEEIMFIHEEDLEVNDTFTVFVYAEDLEEIYGYQVAYLYDEEALELVGVEHGQIKTGDGLSFDIQELNLNLSQKENSVVEVVVLIDKDLDSPFSDDGLLCSFTFKALKSGNHSLVAADVFANSESNPDVFKVYKNEFLLKNNVVEKFYPPNHTIEIILPQPKITSFSPKSSLIISDGTSQNFSVEVVDEQGLGLYYNWFVGDIPVCTGLGENECSYLFSDAGEFVVKVEINDADTTVSQEWDVTVTDIPLTDDFAGSGSINFSEVENISAVTNVVIANENGKIDFGDEVLDFSEVFDLDEVIKIEDGIFALDSSSFPELNKPARITLEGLSYDSVPKIYYGEGFTTNANLINQECDFCEIIESSTAPTTNGKVVFEVEHFSSFRIGGSGIFDLRDFDKLDTCELGVQGNLEISVKNPDDGDDIAPGETIKVEVDVDNDGTENKNIIVEAILYNIDENKEEENFKTNRKKIKDGKDATFEFDFEIPDDLDESEDYFLFVKAYEDGDEDTQCNYEVIEIDMKRESNNIVFKELSLTPKLNYNGGDLTLFVEVENQGTEDEDDVYISVINNELGISEKSELFDLEEYGEKDSFDKTFFIKIPKSAEQGDYVLDIEIVSPEDTYSTSETFSVFGGETIGFLDEEILILGEEATTQDGIGEESKSESDLQTMIVIILVINIIILLILIVFVGRR